MTSRHLPGTKILLCTHHLGEDFLDGYGLLKKIENDAEEGGHPTTKELKGEAKMLVIARGFGYMKGTDVGRRGGRFVAGKNWGVTWCVVRQ